MKKILLSILVLLFVNNIKSQTLGNFNGILNSPNCYEKVVEIPAFPNGVSNLAVDVSIGNIAFWGYIELEITGTWWYQNTPGKLTKLFAIGTNPNGYIYANESRVSDALGQIPNNIAIGEFKWDAANNRYVIPLSHIVSTMNGFALKVKAFSYGDGASNLVNHLFVTPHYTLQALSQNYVSFNNKVGIGISQPATLLNLNNGAGDVNVGTAALRIGGTENYPSLEFGIKGAYDGMISTYGNDLHLYAGNWRSNGAIASENHSISFYTSQNGSSNWNTPKLLLNHYGNVGIGTTTPTEKLSVNGNIRAKKLIVTQNGWPDYVFSKSYHLMPLDKLEAFVQRNSHLPEIPSAAEVESKGLDMGKTQALLLKKMEEMTLYVLDLQRQIKKQQQEINDLKAKRK